MKCRLLLFALVLTCSGAFAQITCTVPVNNTYFQGEYGTIRNTINAYSQLTYANNFVNANCVSSSQVQQIAMLLQGDQYKLEFCKTAYRNVVDKENFYDVYDAFSHFSTVFRLHDYVLTQRGTNIYTTTTYSNTYTYDYPVYNYPDYTTYFGITNCNYPMDETSFYNTYNSYKSSKVVESTKMSQIKDFINLNCLSTAQIMKLTSILTMESNRLDVLKAGYARVYDKGNYSYADQLLPTYSYKLDFTNYINGIGTITTTTTTTTTNNIQCVVTDNDMKEIKNSITSSAFDNTRINSAKLAISSKKCFTVAQIKEILGLFSFEDSKLEVAKYAYDFCSDKSNYYQINDVFSFSSNKDDLTKYIQSKQ